MRLDGLRGRPQSTVPRRRPDAAYTAIFVPGRSRSRFGVSAFRDCCSSATRPPHFVAARRNASQWPDGRCGRSASGGRSESAGCFLSAGLAARWSSVCSSRPGRRRLESARLWSPSSAPAEGVSAVRGDRERRCRAILSWLVRASRSCALIEGHGTPLHRGTLPLRDAHQLLRRRNALFGVCVGHRQPLGVRHPSLDALPVRLCEHSHARPLPRTAVRNRFRTIPPAHAKADSVRLLKRWLVSRELRRRICARDDRG